jgi:hypothetical protein
MRFLLDEDVFPCLKFILEERGHDVRAVSVEPVLAGLSDPDLFELAVREGRAIVTFNRSHYEYLADAARADGRHHPGVITSPQLKGYREFGKAVRWMARLLDRAVEEFLQDKIHRLETF